MSRFFPGAGFVVRPVEGANLMTMGIRTSTATSYHRPQNVGFGITHLLPLVTACLGAERNDVITIASTTAGRLLPGNRSILPILGRRSQSAEATNREN